MGEANDGQSQFWRSVLATGTLGFDAPRCGLCGATENLIKTECCDKWICDDEDQYVLFLYARNSCHRNHRRLTVCSRHFSDEHPGGWQECVICRESQLRPTVANHFYFGLRRTRHVRMSHFSCSCRSAALCWLQARDFFERGRS
jgi:hypothetical protein